MTYNCKEADALLQNVDFSECLSWIEAADTSLPKKDRDYSEIIFNDGNSKLNKFESIFDEMKLDCLNDSDFFLITNSKRDTLGIDSILVLWRFYQVYRQLIFPMAQIAKLFQDKYEKDFADKEGLFSETVSFLKRNQDKWFKGFEKIPLTLYYYPKTAQALVDNGITDFYGFFSLIPVLKEAKELKIDCFCKATEEEILEFAYSYPYNEYGKSLLDWDSVPSDLDWHYETLNRDVNKFFPYYSDLEFVEQYIQGNFEQE